MKKILFFVSIFIFCTLLMRSNAQSPDEAQKWMDYMTPSDMHKMMAKWDGEWNENIKIWATPDAPEQIMQATCINKMIMEGRYQQSKHEGSFSWMPFNGLSTTGWDNIRKIFVSTWIDNFGTGIMYMEGAWDEAAKSINMKGKMTDPITGKLIDAKQTIKIVNDDTQLIEQYITQDGREFKNMEIKLTRNK